MPCFLVYENNFANVPRPALFHGEIPPQYIEKRVFVRKYEISDEMAKLPLELLVQMYPLLDKAPSPRLEPGTET